MAPPKPGKEDITNREYYGTSDAIDAPHEDIETLSSGPPAAQPPRSPTLATDRLRTRETQIDDFLEVSQESTPSPTASDILAKCHIENMVELSNLDRELRGQGVSNAERKKRLLALENSLTRTRKMVEDKQMLEVEARLNESAMAQEKGKGKGAKK
jgi:hypothetical protein